MRILTVTVFAVAAVAQTTPDPPAAGTKPLYKVTIVSRSTKAVNYGYLTLPTTIGFHGTPLLSDAHGDATVQVKRGSTAIQARFSNVPPPGRFGPGFLTYVVWAISPDGRAQNLGELSLGASNKGKLSASTSLQAFAMIVTAEPYYAVTQPSDVVVMENVVTPATSGKVEELNATYELLPRKEFTYEMDRPAPAEGKAVSRAEYESILAVYQARNAIQIAEAQDAQRYAPDRLAQARQLLEQAMWYPKNQSAAIVAAAREAAQVAEDGRAVAVKRAELERSAVEQSKPAPQPEQTAVRRSAAPAEQPEPAPQTRSAPPPPATAAPIVEDRTAADRHNDQPTENRRRLLSALRNSFDAIDTPRGIVLTIPNTAVLNRSLEPALQHLAAAIRPYRSLRVEVEGHS